MAQTPEPQRQENSDDGVCVCGGGGLFSSKDRKSAAPPPGLCSRGDQIPTQLRLSGGRCSELGWLLGNRRRAHLALLLPLLRFVVSARLPAGAAATSHMTRAASGMVATATATWKACRQKWLWLVPRLWVCGSDVPAELVQLTQMTEPAETRGWQSGTPG